VTGDDHVSIRDYVDTMFAEKEKALQAALLAQEKAVAAALAAADKAVEKAESNAEKWRANANEWRGAMSDRDRELPSRREVESSNAGLSTRIASVEKWMDRDVGRTEGISVSAGVVVGALAAVGTILGVVVVLANVLTN
jgi:hypothetical protein